MADSVTPSDIAKMITILEGLEDLIERILQDAWLRVSDLFPEDFKEAPRQDAGSEGLRRYLKIRAFFADPTQHPISRQDLETYCQNYWLPIDDSAEFFFPD
ncbi:hypothetical protein [Myxacorys almedinensis]|uniref:Uncharacterized protein n=1 Tax=Myxacorys almedinensis A TaxID=2690445 RepID=A0A8J7Z4G1_9CYAN|nr:hypothetical protein [Myxacorys almedinensis]NDJ19807.1 hypothetical protein [Myxacorys almedinensis A]